MSDFSDFAFFFVFTVFRDFRGLHRPSKQLPENPLWPLIAPYSPLIAPLWPLISPCNSYGPHMASYSPL